MNNFPEDAILMDWQGDYYNAVGDPKNASVWYKKALTLTEVRETREKLNGLLQEKAKK